MEPALAIHTSARRHLMDRYADLACAYARLPDGGRASDGYTEEARASFPRYNVVEAIQIEIERLDPDDLPAADELVEVLRLAGAAAESVMTRDGNGDIETAAMREERARFLRFVDGLTATLPSEVEPLPYQRVLAQPEAASLMADIEARWPVENGTWWQPVVEHASPPDALVLHSRFFVEPGPGESSPAATVHLRDALARLGISRVVELREYGPSYEVGLEALEPIYTGAEGLFTSSGAPWLLYASHESITVLGGTVVPALIDRWHGWEAARWVG